MKQKILNMEQSVLKQERVSQQESGEQMKSDETKAINEKLAKQLSCFKMENMLLDINNKKLKRDTVDLEEKIPVLEQKNVENNKKLQADLMKITMMESKNWYYNE